MFHRLNKAFGRSLKKTRPPSAEAPDDEFCSYSEHNQNMPQDFEMEFDIPRGLAGKVIGHKGTTCSRIKNVSGANVYVAIPERDDGRTYVEVTGDCEQIEKAFGELRDVIRTVDADWVPRMIPTKTLTLESDFIRKVIGKRGENIRELETNSGASIQIDQEHREDPGRVIKITGTVKSVIDASEQIGSMLNDSNETLKEMSDRLASTRESRRSGKGRSSFGKSQEPERHSEQNDPLKQRYMNLRPERQTSKSASLDPFDVLDEDDDLKDSRKINEDAEKTPEWQRPKSDRRSGKNDAFSSQTKSFPSSSRYQRFLNEMEATVTIRARPQLFRCLIGKDGQNIKDIKADCLATIDVEGVEKAGEFQRVYVRGRISDVIEASRKVHDSLDRYDPKRDNIRNKQGKPLNSEELKEIHGKAEVRILSEMAGYLIGKGGYNINKIKEESRVRSLYVDEREDREGYKTLNVSGDVLTVIDAIEKCEHWLKSFKPPDAKKDNKFHEKKLSHGEKTTELYTDAPCRLEPLSPSKPSPPAAPQQNIARIFMNSDGTYSVQNPDGSLTPAQMFAPVEQPPPRQPAPTHVQISTTMNPAPPSYVPPPPQATYVITQQPAAPPQPPQHSQSSQPPPYYYTPYRPT